jgi:phytanoyl-CoA hydroxylase
MKEFVVQSSEVIRNYRRDGVVVIPSLLDASELAEIRQRLEQYGREQLPSLPSGDYTLEPDGRTIRNLWRIEHHDPWFLEFAGQDRLLSLVRPLLNGEPVLIGVETFNKPARVGSAVPTHQDNAYFCQSPPDVLTVWIALDDATRENGAVEYLLGSHHDLRPHVPSGVKGNSFGLAETPDETEFPKFLGVIPAGAALIHHSQTVHSSTPNRSENSRLSLILVYRGQHTETDPRLKDDYRRALTLTPQNA